MKYLIQFPSSRYFTTKSSSIDWGNPYGRLYGRFNLLEANMYDDIKEAEQIMRRACKGTKIVSIPKKDLFQLKLKGAGNGQ